MIGIIGAMDEEVSMLIGAMEESTTFNKADMTFYEGNIAGKELVVVRSGIGKVNAAICAQILVDKYNVEAIINTGIAGSLDKRIDIGDIVLSEDALQHDVDAVAFGYQKGQIPRMDTLSFKADAKLIELAKSCCEKVCTDIKVFVGRVVSGDQFIADKNVKNTIIDNFGGLCTEMEGAAIAQTAYLNNVPYLIIRAISDKADDSASMDYPTFEKKAIANSVKILTEMINNF
ncbi:MAG: 5'-methylthioadenosine/adenosylhomocysteine nucleosidase [Lachnospiraceae bacterium]|nr:5'-methylthioadenosine/adenosylhomocysteine nucleosidase [Lachnospiraceae bacterium]